MRTDVHVWATGDGRIVKHGDVDAAFLKYPKGSEFSDHEWDTLGLAELFAEEKAMSAPSNKMRTKAEDK
jgi:hypothetical protein